VFDADGRCVLQYAQRPDPGLRPEPRFAGGPLWQSSPLHAALKAEQYHSLWRGYTGGKGDFGAPGIGAYRGLLKKEPGNVEFVLGLARSVLTAVQLRQPGHPLAGPPEETAALAQRNLAEAAAAREPLAARDPRAAVLFGEVRLRQGDRKAARSQFEAAAGDPVAEVGLSRLAAAEGDAAAALRHSAAAIRLLPGSSAVVQLHAANLIRGKKPEEATALLTRLAELDPVDPLTAHLLSLAARDPADRQRWAAAAKTLLDQTDPPATLESEADTRMR
jgi:tetratricopeptide (TPR) repeat protein